MSLGSFETELLQKGCMDWTEVDSINDFTARFDYITRPNRNRQLPPSRKSILGFLDYGYWNLAWISFYNGKIPKNWDTASSMYYDFFVAHQRQETFSPTLQEAAVTHPNLGNTSEIVKIQKFPPIIVATYMARPDMDKSHREEIELYQRVEHNMTDKEWVEAMKLKIAQRGSLIKCLDPQRIPLIASNLPH